MIGILAIQGGVEEHEAMLDKLGILHKRVAGIADVQGVGEERLTGFILPGGESTTMDLFMQKYGLKDWLCSKVQGDGVSGGLKVLGTCAGLILLARYGLLDVTVERNAYGRQLDSFVASVKVDVDPAGPLVGHFIRAPKITHVGDGVRVLAEYEGVPVLVRQGNIWGASFHPELALDSGLHELIFS